MYTNVLYKNNTDMLKQNIIENDCEFCKHFTKLFR